MEAKPVAKCWSVRLGIKEIDRVFYDADCDQEYVRKSLIDHDGYDPRIRVYSLAQYRVNGGR